MSYCLSYAAVILALAAAVVVAVVVVVEEGLFCFQAFIAFRYLGVIFQSGHPKRTDRQTDRLEVSQPQKLF